MKTIEIKWTPKQQKESRPKTKKIGGDTALLLKRIAELENELKELTEENLSLMEKLKQAEPKQEYTKKTQITVHIEYEKYFKQDADGTVFIFPHGAPVKMLPWLRENGFTWNKIKKVYEKVDK